MNHLYVLSLSLMKDSYKILGVDPGTNQLGYALIEVRGKELKLITLGILRLKSYEDHQTKLKEILDRKSVV